MAKNLLIVESPAKAKTIEKILGKDFEVKSCYGHIRDLAKEDMGIDIKNGYKPAYIVSDDKHKVVGELRSIAKKSQEVWLATDEDREGEAISWHLCEVLGLDPLSTKRIVFHEITKPAIKKAVEHPRTVNMDLVNAQQARRVLDRLVGFELSPVLWRKMSMRNNLSAGRVQSVAVRLIVDREREINHFQPKASFKIEAFFQSPDIHGKNILFKAEGPTNVKDAKGAEDYLKKCVSANYKVAGIEVKPAKRTPAAPFTTSTLQQEASRKLGYPVAKTMRVAQTLYESGHITYMRTDSVNLSDTALEALQQTITAQYGNKYFQHRTFKNKNESAQEAHEAIRPTDMNTTAVGDADTQRLYELIWKRTMASQMADAQFERTIAKIAVSTHSDPLTASGEVLKFDGFLKVYTEGRDDEDGEEESSSNLPPLHEGQALDLHEMRATEKFTRPQPRYTEASLVKKMEELGIGRPSTYAPTISTIQQRGYVERRDKEGVKRAYQILSLKAGKISAKSEFENVGAERAKLFPTDLGMVVTDFLKEHFTRVMDYSFTAKIEQEFDEIAQGKIAWDKMIDGFYHPFHERVEKTIETAARAKGERELGNDPQSGKPVLARLGRFGPMVQIGNADEEEKPRFATLKSNQSIETITLEEALDLFKLPMTLGEYEGKEVSVNLGRFGPYVKWGDQFISIPKNEEPLSVSIDRAIQLISEKQQADAPVGNYQGKPVTKGKGRFGPFIKWENLYINVPRKYDFDNLSQKDIEELVSTKVEKESKRYIQQWPDEKIALENGRWGAFIRFGKLMLKLGKKKDGEKYMPEEIEQISLAEVKRMIIDQMPDAFTTKATKKVASKKSSTTPKKSSTKKAATTQKTVTAKKTSPKKK
ncbi:MAG: type I DNA topoisomerase [Bacteroidetes bacterium]|nr:type I DNA topoisomerase [Bacteroidota bacterium]